MTRLATLSMWRTQVLRRSLEPKSRRTLVLSFICTTVWTSVSAQFITNPTPQGPASAVAPVQLVDQPNIVKAKGTKNRAKLVAYSDAAWRSLNSTIECNPTVNAQCAREAYALAMSTCSASSMMFQRDTKAWQITEFAFVIASATFTGIGASTTISQAKVFSTLGGTTGLGAVTATVKADISGDQAGITAINANQEDLKTFITTAKYGFDGKSLPTSDQIWYRANAAASSCIGAPVGVVAAGPGSVAGTGPVSAGGAGAGSGAASGSGASSSGGSGSDAGGSPKP